MTDAQFEVIVRKLDAISSALGALVRLRVMDMTEGKSQSEQIWLFSTIGLAPKDIAAAIGTSPNSVRVALSNLRKSRRKK